MNYRDFTLKAKVVDSESIERALASIHAQFIAVDKQTDHYFQTENGKLKWRQGSFENLITHYERFLDSGIERTVVHRYDVNPSRGAITDLFRNHQKIGETNKERKIYLLENIKIHLDKFGDEQFIEFEAIDRDNLFSNEDLIAQCSDLKSKLGIRDEDLVRTGYFAS